MEEANHDEAPHRRISKACHNCVQRKSKCNGRSPCDICLRRGHECHYRARNRIRPTAVQRRAIQTAATHSTVDSGGKQLSIQSHDGSSQAITPTPPDIDKGNDLQTGISASQSLSQLYYGPSSNFAFLQHVHRAFTRPSKSPEIRSQHSQEVFDRFKNRDLFFGINKPKQPRRLSTSNLMFLPQALARVFFDKFVASMWHMMPYLDLNELEDLLGQLYRTEAGTPLDPGDLATILLVLANGATLTNHDGWVQELAQRAKREVPELDEVVSIASIKISMLLACYYAGIGRANTSYMQGGIAIRKAYATGMHRDIDYDSPTSTREQRAENRKVTFWSSVLLERWFAFWLGRPSAVIGEAISIGVPEGNPFIRALAGLSNIIAQCLSLMYEDSKFRQPVKLWEAAQHIRHQLLVFQIKTEGEVGFPLDGTVTEPVNIEQVYIMHIFLHVWMTTFRPFPVIFLTWKRRNTHISSTESSTDSAQLPVDMWWLPEACEIAVINARKMVYFFAAATRKSELACGLVFTGAFLESACCLLFYHSMADRTTIDQNIAALKEAIDSIGRMIQKGPVPAITKTIAQLLSELETVKTNDATPDYASPVLRRLPSTFAASDPMRMTSAQGASMDIGQMTLPADFATQPQTGGFQFNPNMPDLDWESIWSSVQDPDTLSSSLFAPDLGEFFDLPPPPPQ